MPPALERVDAENAFERKRDRSAAVEASPPDARLGSLLAPTEARYRRPGPAIRDGDICRERTGGRPTAASTGKGRMARRHALKNQRAEATSSRGTPARLPTRYQSRRLSCPPSNANACSGHRLEGVGRLGESARDLFTSPLWTTGWGMSAAFARRHGQELLELATLKNCAIELTIAENPLPAADLTSESRRRKRL